MGQINMDLSNSPSGTNDRIEVGGNLSLYPYTNVQINPVSIYLGIGNYHLIHFAGSINGSGSIDLILASAPPDDTRQTYTLSSATTHYIDLLVGSPTLTWVGGSGGSNDWDVKTTTNWSGTSDHLFYNCDQVNFTDSSANNTVNITAPAVLPGSITVNSSSGHDYTFTGTGKISGGTGLTLNGIGRVTLANRTANDFTGTININSGTLQIGDGTYNSGIASTVAIINNGALIINPASDVIMANVISGTGTLTKQGSGMLTLSTSNSYTGPTIINGGVLELVSTGQISTVSDISTADDATFLINGGSHTVGTISGTGTTCLAAGSELTASSINQDTLTLGPGAVLTIAALPGGPLAEGYGISPVPEPSAMILFSMGTFGLFVYAWRIRGISKFFKT